MNHENKETARIPADVKEIVSTQNFAVLSTYGDEYPYTSLIAFAACDDCAGILFLTLRTTHKYAYLKKNPRVSLLVDTQTNDALDLMNARALSVFGEAREVATEKHPLYAPIFFKRFPQLKEFFHSPACALVYISVHAYRLVARFQEVREYRVAHKKV
jgi:heme iron utilization protein